VWAEWKASHSLNLLAPGQRRETTVMVASATVFIAVLITALGIMATLTVCPH